MAPIKKSFGMENADIHGRLRSRIGETSMAVHTAPEIRS